MPPGRKGFSAALISRIIDAAHPENAP